VGEPTRPRQTGQAHASRVLLAKLICVLEGSNTMCSVVVLPHSGVDSRSVMPLDALGCTRTTLIRGVRAGVALQLFVITNPYLRKFLQLQMF